MKIENDRLGFLFKKFIPPFQTPFEKLFEIFKELITHTSGDFDEAIDWLRELDKEYKLTEDNYTIDDFIEDLLKKSYIKINNPNNSAYIDVFFSYLGSTLTERGKCPTFPLFYGTNKI